MSETTQRIGGYEPSVRTVEMVCDRLAELGLAVGPTPHGPWCARCSRPKGPGSMRGSASRSTPRSRRSRSPPSRPWASSPPAAARLAPRSPRLRPSSCTCRDARPRPRPHSPPRGSPHPRRHRSPSARRRGSPAPVGRESTSRKKSGAPCSGGRGAASAAAPDLGPQARPGELPHRLYRGEGGARHRPQPGRRPVPRPRRLAPASHRPRHRDPHSRRLLLRRPRAGGPRQGEALPVGRGRRRVAVRLRGVGRRGPAPRRRPLHRRQHLDPGAPHAGPHAGAPHLPGDRRRRGRPSRSPPSPATSSSWATWVGPTCSSARPAWAARWTPRRGRSSAASSASSSSPTGSRSGRATARARRAARG